MDAPERDAGCGLSVALSAFEKTVAIVEGDCRRLPCEFEGSSFNAAHCDPNRLIIKSIQILLWDLEFLFRTLEEQALQLAQGNGTIDQWFHFFVEKCQSRDISFYPSSIPRDSVSASSSILWAHSWLVFPPQASIE